MKMYKAFLYTVNFFSQLFLISSSSRELDKTWSRLAELGLDSICVCVIYMNHQQEGGLKNEILLECVI